MNEEKIERIIRSVLETKRHGGIDGLALIAWLEAAAVDLDIPNGLYRALLKRARDEIVEGVRQKVTVVGVVVGG